MSSKEQAGAVTSSRSALFVASCVALVVSAMAFGIRGDILGDLATQFHTKKEAIGWAITGAFWGFTISIAIGGIICDWIGMKGLLVLAFIAHILGITFTIYAPTLGVLAFATLMLGLGNGFVESAVNPLIATLYPDNKTAKLNALHAWWPGGIVIGAVLSWFLGEKMHQVWQVKQALCFIPALAYGFMFIGLKLPPTERVQSGVSTGSMYREALRPLFLVWIFCMLLTASTELGTNQWIGEMMKGAGIANGILILAWISIIMLLGRTFAGPVIHKLAPTGMLVLSATISTIGLIALSHAKTSVTAYAASGVFAVGLCYFWPTMLGFTSERFPKGGALLMGLVGAAGMASAGFAQPAMAWLVDHYGTSGALLRAAVFPGVLIVIFGCFYLSYRAKGGYKAERLSASAEEAAAMADGEA